MIRGLLIGAVAVIAFNTAPGYAAGKADWSYSGKDGPQHWSSLDPAYAACASGKNQSPINLTRFVESDLKPIVFDYKSGGTEVLNNGHTIQVNFKPGSKITVDGRAFALLQVHFTRPAKTP